MQGENPYLLASHLYSKKQFAKNKKANWTRFHKLTRDMSVVKQSNKRC